jgi:hypothetical protein
VISESVMPGLAVVACSVWGVNASASMPLVPAVSCVNTVYDGRADERRACSSVLLHNLSIPLCRYFLVKAGLGYGGWRRQAGLAKVPAVAFLHCRDVG